MAGTTLHGSQSYYFHHDLMRFFARAVLDRPYEEVSAVQPAQSPFCFDPATRTISRPSDPLTPLALRDYPTRLMELRQLVVSWARQVRRGTPPQPLFRIPGLRACGMVIHPRDTATVIAQRRPRGVWKVVRDASHNAVLDGEREGARLAPSLAPAVLEWQPARDAAPGYVRLEYVLDTEPVTATDLPAVLRRITPALIDACRASGVVPVTADAFDAELRESECRLAAGRQTPLTGAGLEVLRDIRRHLARRAEHRAPVLCRSFAHGDIQSSNLRRSRGRLALIDWGNSGTHNVLFDAFIVELFAPTPAVWQDVLVRGVVDPGRGFQGWLPDYLDQLASAAGVRLSPADVAVGLICSMAEKTIAIVARHAATDEARGLHSLGRVQRLLAAAGPL